MSKRSRTRARRWTTVQLKLQTRELDRASQRAPAIVFAPHPDDETLGCGGTILKKRSLGAPVEVVFLTDGTKSPPARPAAELKSMREREARAACQALTVERDSVTFMEFEDGTLAEQTQAATDRVTQFLRQHPARQIFVPYHRDFDPGLDHPAANRIVLAALHALGTGATVYEYGVWFWRFWPRSKRPTPGQPRAWQAEKHSRLTNHRALLAFRRSVRIEEVLEQKQTAFNQHVSQASGLSSIQNGDFLKWFFWSHEVFCRHTLPGQR